MQCPRCGYFTLPGQTECPRCTVNVSTSPLDIEPPRAGKLRIFFRKIKYSMKRYARYVIEYYTTEEKAEARLKEMSPKDMWMIYMLSSIIPGLGHIKEKYYHRATLFMSGFFALLPLVIFFWGSPVGIYAIGILLFWHVYCIMNVCGYYFKTLSIIKYIAVSLLVSCFLIVGVYMPVNSLRRHIIDDIIINIATHSEIFDKGDMVFVSRAFFAPERLKHGDLVVFKLSGGRVDGRYRGKYAIFVRATTCIDRVLGIPGDTVEFSEDAILINGKKLPKELYPLNTQAIPKNVKVTVPKDHCFVYPSIWDFGIHEQGFDSVQYKLDKGILPFKSIEGRVFMVYQPLKKRRFL